jgi:hypothetical protein
MSEPVLQVKDKNGAWRSIPSLKGDPGLTPFIGANGNWWIGDIDMGVRSKGIDGVLIATGTYDGVNSGTDYYLERKNPAVINFDFAPQFVMVVRSDYPTKYHESSSALLIRSFPYGFCFGHALTDGGYLGKGMTGAAEIYTTFTDNSVSFYKDGPTPGGYFNTSGVTYHYFAIG